MIDHHDAVITLERGLDGADLCARRIVAVVTQQQYFFFAVLFATLVLEGDLSNPVDIPPAVSVICDVILVPACFQTFGTT
jgi:hypothetical protein